MIIHKALPTMWCNLLLHFSLASGAILSESWAMLSRGASQPRCVEIPQNFTLCRGLEYGRMRLPNLLDQETLAEATEQAGSWVPLLRLNCHPDAQLFLCSLFAPVCLEKHDAIQPCRSLCEAVQKGCESRMIYHGFPWPEMLRCDKFPLTTDMCIQPRANYGKNEDQICSSCRQVSTFENILDTFCRSSHVLKVKVKRVDSTHLVVRRGRALKPSGYDVGNHLRGLPLYFTKGKDQCPCDMVRQKMIKAKKSRFLVMGSLDPLSGQFTMNLILPWERREKRFKRAVRMFRRLNCRQIGERIRNRARRERVRHYGNGRRREYRSLDADHDGTVSLEEYDDDNDE